MECLGVKAFLTLAGMQGRRAGGPGAGNAGRLAVLAGRSGPRPEGWALGLPGIYAGWAVVLAVLYIPCRWFAGVKARHSGGWLSYF